MNEQEKKLIEHIEFIYGKENVQSITDRIFKRLGSFREQNPHFSTSKLDDRVSEVDTILITYGDMVQSHCDRPLKTLASFLQDKLGDLVSTIHILPFYPFSSDDGFSVINYYQVNPNLGSWTDIKYLGKHFRLMFDAVVNHISSQSTWFQGFLSGNQRYEEYFITIKPGTDLSQVFRPRASPVLTAFETTSGRKLVWTTFSADQIDLNYANPEVLLEVIDILLFFVSNGADFIRLDAVTFVWKEVGTTCVNSPHTHRIVQMFRTILDMVAPSVSLVTETNVPHKDNIAYFGDGYNEAQMVYNFSLPMLTLNAFHNKDARKLSEWASTLHLPSEQATFFNFLACHDGIGLLPVKNILPPSEIEAIIERTKKLGGYVSYKGNEDGSHSPYELNINYLDALDDPNSRERNIVVLSKRFLASQSIMLALRGVPGIYFHSLFGSRNWIEGVDATGRYRTINREKLQRSALEKELADSGSLTAKIFNGFCRMLKVRKKNPAFHPMGGQEILCLDKSIFAVLRTSCQGDIHTLCLTNVTDKTINLNIDISELPISGSDILYDTINTQVFRVNGTNLSMDIAPYQVRWLRFDVL